MPVSRVGSGPVALLAGLACVVPACHARAQDVTLVDQAVTLHYPSTHWGAAPGADLTGAEPAAATDILYNSGWWYRVEGDTREYPLPPPDTESWDGGDHFAQWYDVDGKNWELQLWEYVFDHEGPSGGFASHLRAINRGLGNRRVWLFHYLDVDAGGTAANDDGHWLNSNYLEQREVGGSSVVRYRGVSVRGGTLGWGIGAAALYPSLRNRLNDAVIDDFFPSTAPVGPGDVSAAYEFGGQLLGPNVDIQGSVAVYANMPSRYVKGAAPDLTPFPALVYHDTSYYRSRLMRRASMLPVYTQDFIWSPLYGRPVGVDDFDGDYTNDILYRNLGDGAVWVNGVPLAGATPPPLNWVVTATGDFNADGKADILWRNTTSQQLIVWFMNGAERVGAQAPDPDHAVDGNWDAAGTGDFNGDGFRDILWYNQTSGKLVIWYMNGTLQRIAGGFTDPPSVGNNNWKVVAVGDYGKGPSGALPAVWNATDIVWQNDTSYKIVIWYMDQQGRRTSGTFTTPDLFGLWRVVVGPR